MSHNSYYIESPKDAKFNTCRHHFLMWWRKPWRITHLAITFGVMENQHVRKPTATVPNMTHSSYTSNALVGGNPYPPWLQYCCKQHNPHTLCEPPLIPSMPPKPGGIKKKKEKLLMKSIDLHMPSNTSLTSSLTNASLRNTKHWFPYIRHSNFQSPNLGPPIKM